MRPPDRLVPVAAEGGGAIPPAHRGGGQKRPKKFKRKTLKKSFKIKFDRGRQTITGAHLAKTVLDWFPAG